MPKTRKFKGYAVLSSRGSIIYSTMNPSREGALHEFERHNPTVEGISHGEKLVKYTLLIEDE